MEQSSVAASTPKSSPVIYEYLSYPAFLRDTLEFRKQKSPGFSLSAFCLRSRVLSKSYLSMVLRSHRRLPAKKISLLAEALGLGPKEQQYFEGLVHFNHARNDREKHVFLRRLAQARPRKHQANLPQLGYGVLYSWHCLVILELAKLPAFRSSGKWISERLRGRLSTHEAKRALDTLVQTKLLAPDAQGRLRVTQNVIRTSDELTSLAIQKYHHACLELGADVLRTVGLDGREFGSVNVRLTPAGLMQAKEKMKAFREEILSLSEEGNGAAVCQLNFQLLNLEK